MTTHVRIAIVGSGFGGLGTAIRLRRAGIDDFVVLERAGDVGGTWRDNTYPGCACDVQSHLYSFSFLPNPDWSRSYSPQPEIQRYLQRCARDEGILPFVRFGHDVQSAAWDDEAQRWTVVTSRGTLTADVLVMAQGALSDPAVPRLPGIERFEGTTFHSARWDHAHDLRGRDVAVVGTGASAIQFVPEIQPLVRRLALFQRTAPWVLPRHEWDTSPRLRRLFRRVPAAQRLVRDGIWAARELLLVLFRHPALMRAGERLAKAYLRQVVADPALRAKLTPDFRLGCKRVLLSSAYLPALVQPNVEVVTDAIAEVRARSIVDAAGREHPVDTIIYGTGFRVTDPPLAHAVTGRDGRTLAERWNGSPTSHLGVTVPGFPNLFMLMGPNTGLGHSSVVYMIEAQVEHVLGAVRHLDATGAAAVEPTPEAERRWLDDVARRMRGTVWVDGHCRSWYLDPTGRNSTLWPDHSWRYRRRVARFVPDEYRLVPRRAPVVAGAGA